MDAVVFSDTKDGLTVVAYPGDNKILIAMSLADDAIDRQEKNLAGFTVWRTFFGQKEALLSNRIGFTVGVQGNTDGEWTPSDQAPFQKFRWIDVPPDGFDKPITYRIRALYFSGQGHATKAGPEVTLNVQPVRNRHANFRAYFTRGYIASQAYHDKFGNKDIRPDGPKTLDFNTSDFKAQYTWLGADARVALFDFIADCQKDQKAQIDVFAYDLDEPDVIAAICDMGKQGRLRAILDNADLHSKPTKSKRTGKLGPMPLEVEAAKRIKAACGEDRVRQGKFDRYQHNKVFIKRDANGKAQRVLFGSMNFSIRGIYVQANNVIVVDDPGTADMFARAFDVAFTDNVKAPLFRQNAVSQDYMVCSAADSAALPKFKLALSPHRDWSVSLGPMTTRIRAATSSVFYAVMAPKGSGPVLGSLKEIAKSPVVFSYGTVETDKGLAVQNASGAMGAVTGFAALLDNVPENFAREFDGGQGMHIHDKFVVVDFNAENPTVFTGSSNLAAGGETENGDSLTMIEDASIANMFAIEALALFDHYRFRETAKKRTDTTPLTLWYPGKEGQPNPWWTSAYDKTSIKMRDRCLFAKIQLPADMKSTKTVDWASVDAEDKGGGSGRAAAKTGASKRSPAKTAAKKAPSKRARAGTSAAKKAPAKKATAKKATAKKATATAKRASARTAPAKRATAKKRPTKAPSRKRPAKTAPSKRRPVAKRTPSKRAGARRTRKR